MHLELQVNDRQPPFLSHGNRLRDAGAETPNPTGAHVKRFAGAVDLATRMDMLGQTPVTIWLTGLSGSGKSTLAFELEQQLVRLGHPCYVLDGDNIRHGLTRDLGFKPEDRRENIRRVAHVAQLMNDAGLIVITSLISPMREDRSMAREIIGAPRFVETWLTASVEVCARRDPKGLYAKAYAGEIPSFTGISAPYETPENPALKIDTAAFEPSESVASVLDYLRAEGVLETKAQDPQR